MNLRTDAAVRDRLDEWAKKLRCSRNELVETLVAAGLDAADNMEFLPPLGALRAEVADSIKKAGLPTTPAGRDTLPADHQSPAPETKPSELHRHHFVAIQGTTFYRSAVRYATYACACGAQKTDKYQR